MFSPVNVWMSRALFVACAARVPEPLPTYDAVREHRFLNSVLTTVLRPVLEGAAGAP